MMKVSGKDDTLPLIVAADPGKIAGFAAYVPNAEERSYRLTRYGLLKPTTVNKVDRILEWADDLSAGSNGISGLTLAIEDQYLGVNPQTLISIVESRMRWQAIAELYGATIENFAPQQWQAPMLGARHMKRVDRKRASKNQAHFFFKGASFTIDESDAVIIGAYLTRLQIARIENSLDTFPFEGERL